MEKSILYQITAQELETFTEGIINKVLQQRIKEPEQSISVDDYCHDHGMKRQTVLSYLRKGELPGKKVGKFWEVIVSN